MAATRRAYTGGATSTTTTSAIAASGTTSFTITAYTGWPYGSDPFFVVVEPGTASEEKILVTRTGSTDTTINIASDSERGQDGTSAVAHSSGSTVFPVFTALDADEANAVASVITADTTNSRVGIGTASPSFPLSVDINAPATYGNASGNFAQMWTNSGTNALGVSLGDNLGAGFITNNGYDLHLGTSGTSRVTVQSGGNVGINDTTPSYTLDVTGDINATGDLRIGGTAIGTWTDYTPTVTTDSGTITTGSLDFAQYSQINDFVLVRFGYLVTTAGTAAGARMNFTGPSGLTNLSPSGSGLGSGRENAVTGASLVVLSLGGSGFRVDLYTGGGWIQNNRACAVTFIFKV